MGFGNAESSLMGRGRSMEIKMLGGITWHREKIHCE